MSVISACCLLFNPLISLASAQSDQQQIQALQKQTQLLQQQLQMLQAQVANLQQHRQHQQPARQHYHAIAMPQSQHRVITASPRFKQRTQQKSTKGSHADTDRTPAWIYHYSTPIVTSPYLGTHAEFDGSDLIINFASINTDLDLLQERQNLGDRLAQLNLPDLKHPLVEMSGTLQPEFIWARSSNGKPSTDADLGSSELDFAVLVNKYVNGFIGLEYDNAQPLAYVSSRRIANSRIYLGKGFITLGNLNSFPLYTTLGQLYVPFGRYSTNMISSPLTKIMGRTNARTLLLGYHPKERNGLYAEVFTFAGDARKAQNRELNQYGANLGYSYVAPTFHYDVGVSYIRNMADADGIQATGGAIFGGFASPGSSEILVNYVPGIDYHGALGIGQFTFLGEYLSATSSYNITNLMYNNNGAKPSAANLEAAYNFHFIGLPSAFAVGYGLTRQALALDLPKERYIATIKTSFWRNTIASLEFRHDKNYGVNDIASGTNSAVINAANDTSLGKSANAVTAQFAVFF